VADDLVIDDTPTPQAKAKAWRGRITRAEARQKNWHAWWDACLKAYAPSVKDDPKGYQETVRTNRIFTIVERKSAELFYQKPEITVSASPLLEALGPDGAKVASAHGAILNEELGLDGVNVRELARRVIFDYLLFSIGPTKIGFRSYTKDVPTAVPTGAVDPLTGQPETAIQVIPVPVKREVFWENLSPKQFLIPADWTSTRFDEAPWLGFTFSMGLHEAKRLYKDKIPADFKGGDRKSDEREFDHGDAPDAMPSTDTVSGTEIWYRTSAFDPNESHPDHLSQIVLLDGIPEPVEDRPSPDQTFDAQGRMTPDSLIGYPLHPLVIRTLTDAAYVMSDVAIALPLVQELDKFRTQMVQQRDATILRYFHNTDLLPNEALEKAIAAPLGGSVGLPGDAFPDITRVIAAMPHGPFPRENFTMNDYLDNDLARTHAIDATSSGTTENSQTATEAQLRQANVNVRLGWEQGFVADWYLRGVTKFSTLVQRYLDVDDAAQIVGQPAAQLWDKWRRESPTSLSFTMAPDSSLRNDTPLDRKQLQDVFTYLANDPSLNRSYLTTKLLTKYHLDPSQAILPPAQVPQPKPQPPNLSLAFKGEDLNPMSPQSPIVLDILSKMGVQIDPTAIQNAMGLGQVAMAAQQAQAAAQAAAKGPDGQPPHPGKAVPIESMDKHQADTTGAMQGSGQLMPQMSGGDPGVQ
jgi:hypothetical protein